MESVFQIFKKIPACRQAGKNSKARKSRLKTMHGKVDLPNFMPIATRAAVKNLTSDELKEIGAEIILSNTYHLFLRPGVEIIKGAGGLHQFMNWPGPILTDSGGYQVFSLAKWRKIKKEGVEFSSEIDGQKFLLTPEKAIEIQKDLGADIMICLDVCPAGQESYEEIKKAADITFAWAKRAKKVFARNESLPESRRSAFGGKKQLLFGIVQGGIYPDLREKSAREITSLSFDGYALGGFFVGEEEKNSWPVIRKTISFLPSDKPRYLMGAGRPEQIVKAVKLGIDLFDCVIPTRNARHGLVYVNTKSQITNYKLQTNSKSQIPNKFYEEIHIANSKYTKDFSPVDKNCSCFTCQNFSRAYLRHLYLTKEPLALRLLTIHNLYFYLSLMKRIRENIELGNL